MNRVPRCMTVILLTAALSACGVGASGQRISKENDRLRSENLALRKEMDAMQTRIAQRVAEIDTLKQRHPDLQSTVDGAEILTLTNLRFDRYSGPLDTDRDGRDDVLRIYLITQDQHARFISVAGQLDIRLFIHPPQGDPKLVGEKHYDPAAFKAAYRQGFTGVFYTLETPLPDNLAESVNALTAQVVLTDAAGGAQHTLEKTFPLTK